MMTAAMPHRYYHGTRAELSPDDVLAPAAPSVLADHAPTRAHVLLTPMLDEAIWSAEIASARSSA